MFLPITYSRSGAGAGFRPALRSGQEHVVYSRCGPVFYEDAS
jgi:hypothetical protein